MALRNYILDNLRWKLFSLLLAALTWLTINSTFEKKRIASEISPLVKTTTLNYTAVPVTLLAGPGNTNRFKVDPEKVWVAVNVSPEDAVRLNPRDVQAFVDVTGSEDEKSSFHRPIQPQVPRNLNVVSITVTPTNATVERIFNPK